MKLKNILLYLLFILPFCACKKDLGNYNYHPPSEPVIVNLGGATYPAIVGDSLIIDPYISFDGDPVKDLTFDWVIYVSEEARADHYTGFPLKIIYNLQPIKREALLTVTDKRNGQKYFITFSIDGQTQFFKGSTVLSVKDGITKLSFIKPNNRTVLADLYTTLNHEDLPANPTQLFAKPLAYQPGSVERYWVLCNDKVKGGVIVDANTMLKVKTFAEQFFITPATIVPYRFEASNGTPTAVINGKLYLSITQTAPFAPDFGKFSSFQPGDYMLSGWYLRGSGYFFGFNTKTNAFVSFNGGADYMGTDYTVIGNHFDPKNVGAGELIYMQPQSGTSYAFFKAANGKVYELSFNLEMDDYDARKITTYYKREFKGAALLTPDTKWQHSSLDVFYFTSNNKIYRYNPINESIRALDANFAEKKITMLQLSQDGNTITAGVDGAIITIDVSVGVNGTITKTVTGIPGAPVDIFIRS